MINVYAYTYPGAVSELEDFILVKLGDSHRAVDTRMGEQGGAAEWQGKIKIGAWNNLQTVKRDHDLHKVLELRGLRYKDGGAGTEWFKVPAASIVEAHAYIDQLIEDFEGEKVRDSVVLRPLQQKALDQAMAVIRSGEADTSLIANLCPRFGKTIWALSLFNKISEEYGNRVMLLPSYWLSVHTSFVDTLNDWKDFNDIALIDPNDPDAALVAANALDNGQRIIIQISLHGDLAEWSKKHNWISEIDNDEFFMFADEGDFGTHTENQVAKVDFLLN